MELRKKQASRRGGADRFIGEVWIDQITDDTEPARIRVSVVRFAPAPGTRGTPTPWARRST